jgi:hypothetical protein
MHENRETSASTGREERHSPAGEGRSRTARMHDAEESDRFVVPVNQPNKAEPWKTRAAAEVGEGRERTKENFAIAHALDTERGRRVPRIARCATSGKEKEARTVHGSASPSKCRSAAGKLLRIEAASDSWSRRRDVARVRGRAGGSAYRSAQPGTPGSVSGTTLTESLHTEG